MCLGKTSRTWLAATSERAGHLSTTKELVRSEQYQTLRMLAFSKRVLTTRSFLFFQEQKQTAVLHSQTDYFIHPAEENIEHATCWGML